MGKIVIRGGKPARNGQIIATSEGYVTKANCENGIQSVKKNAEETEIVEE